VKKMCRNDKKNDLDTLNKAKVLEDIACSTNAPCTITTAKIKKAKASPREVYAALVRLVGRNYVSLDSNTLRVEKEGRVGVYSAAKFVGYLM
jgi:hypothetical protein